MTTTMKTTLTWTANATATAIRNLRRPTKNLKAARLLEKVARALEAFSDLEWSEVNMDALITLTYYGWDRMTVAQVRGGLRDARLGRLIS